MNTKSNFKKEPTTIILFLASITLVFAFLVINLAFQKSGPSIRNGATEEEINNYAYQLLEAKPENALGYQEAIKYYKSQISAASEPEQVFSLKLDLASFFGRTGDPISGLTTLEDISPDSLSPIARYYLYATLSYLYDRDGDSETATEYYQRITDEGIYDYIAKLDAGEIDPSSATTETTETVTEPTDQDESSEDDCEEECESEDYRDES